MNDDDVMLPGVALPHHDLQRAHASFWGAGVAGMPRSQTAANDGRAMDLLTDIMRLMHPAPSSTQSAGEHHTLSPCRRSMESDLTGQGASGDHGHAMLSADELSDPAHTVRPLSSSSSTAGESRTLSCCACCCCISSPGLRSYALCPSLSMCCTFSLLRCICSGRRKSLSALLQSSLCDQASTMQ